MSELEKQQAKEIAELRELLGLKSKDKSKAFSDVTMYDLESLVDIERNFNDDIFEPWFNNNIEIKENIIKFLENLLSKYGKIMKAYNEDTLKVVFIGAIIERVEFFNQDLRIGKFYHKNLTYKNDKINFNGYCDFYVAKGLEYPQSPYFFIQEYKPSKNGSDPEPQLLAELICAVELNSWKNIKGCYIIGAIWNFVILEKLGENRYQYFVSANFDSSKMEDLKGIFRNLMFVKDEIVEMIKKDKS